jgi:hypothetical protein
MEPKYGKDYGIKVDVPWDIKCPIINRMFDTCLVEISLTTFTSDGAPLIGVADRFRIPIQKSRLDIRSLVRLDFALPKHECVSLCGNGLFVKVTLLEVNHKEVLSTTEDIPLSASFYALPKEERVWFGDWYKDMCIDLKFGNKDFYEI